MNPDRIIAVLPLEPVPAEGDNGWFARGITEDLITELSRFPQLGVIHPHSTFAHEVGEMSDAEVGQDLGAAYVVRGTIRRSDRRVVLSTRLVESRTGRQLAAERLECEPRQLPDLEQEIAGRIAASLATRIDDAHRQRARGKSVADLEAYECWLKGLDELRQGSVEHDDRARELFERALELDPCFARAYAGISLSHFNEWSCQAWFQWDKKAQAAAEAAEQAIALDDADHVAHLILGRVDLFRRNFDSAAHRFELALSLNANDADALVQIALGISLLGDHHRALELIQRARRLNPRHSTWYFAFEICPRLLNGEYEEVLRLCELAGNLTVDLPACRAAAAAALGRDEEAQRYLAEFLESFRDKVLFGQVPEPGEPLRWILHVNPTRRPEDEQTLVEALRKAGLAPDPDAQKHSSTAPLGPWSNDDAVFCRDGDGWAFAFRGESVRLSEVKGFRDLAMLLGSPQTPVHCLELADRPVSGDRDDPTLDSESRARIGSRAAELQAEIDEARAHHDIGRAEALEAELDELVEHLSKAMGFRGRSRSLGSASEKARTAVTWRIRSAIRKLGTAHPELGRHLQNSVRTGTFCVYEPERSVAWQL